MGISFIGSSAITPNCPPDALETTYYPYPDDCAKFWECFLGVATLNTCPDGLYFNPKIQSCDYLRNVDCKSSLFRGVVEHSCECPSGIGNGIKYECDISFTWDEEIPCDRDSPCMKSVNEEC